ncbi:hypothetical protein [Mobiluncus curtisii]|nr:hypothetical protein [Mobiluncus curtisii]NMW48779.1 hypothetical protein [Mobiluncus curtisii]NMX12947.1 hypothetical protein [Mobiluncus curtisii]
MLFGVLAPRTAHSATAPRLVPFRARDEPGWGHTKLVTLRPRDEPTW